MPGSTCRRIASRKIEDQPGRTTSSSSMIWGRERQHPGSPGAPKIIARRPVPASVADRFRYLARRFGHMSFLPEPAQTGLFSCIGWKFPRPQYCLASFLR